MLAKPLITQIKLEPEDGIPKYYPVVCNPKGDYDCKNCQVDDEIQNCKNLQDGKGIQNYENWQGENENHKFPEFYFKKSNMNHDIEILKSETELGLTGNEICPYIVERASLVTGNDKSNVAMTIDNNSNTMYSINGVGMETITDVNNQGMFIRWLDFSGVNEKHRRGEMINILKSNLTPQSKQTNSDDETDTLSFNTDVKLEKSKKSKRAISDNATNALSFNADCQKVLKMENSENNMIHTNPTDICNIKEEENCKSKQKSKWCGMKKTSTFSQEILWRGFNPFKRLDAKRLKAKKVIDNADGSNKYIYLQREKDQKGPEYALMKRILSTPIQLLTRVDRTDTSLSQIAKADVGSIDQLDNTSIDQGNNTSIDQGNNISIDQGDNTSIDQGDNTCSDQGNNTNRTSDIGICNDYYMNELESPKILDELVQDEPGLFMECESIETVESSFRDEESCDELINSENQQPDQENHIEAHHLKSLQNILSDVKCKMRNLKRKQETCDDQFHNKYLKSDIDFQISEQESVELMSLTCDDIEMGDSEHEITDTESEASSTCDTDMTEGGQNCEYNSDKDIPGIKVVQTKSLANFCETDSFNMIVKNNDFVELHDAYCKSLAGKEKESERKDNLIQIQLSNGKYAYVKIDTSHDAYCKSLAEKEKELERKDNLIQIQLSNGKCAYLKIDASSPFSSHCIKSGVNSEEQKSQMVHSAERILNKNQLNLRIGKNKSPHKQRDSWTDRLLALLYHDHPYQTQSCGFSEINSKNPTPVVDCSTVHRKDFIVKQQIVNVNKKRVNLLSLLPEDINALRKYNSGHNHNDKKDTPINSHSEVEKSDYSENHLNTRRENSLFSSEEGPQNTSGVNIQIINVKNPSFTRRESPQATRGVNLPITNVENPPSASGESPQNIREVNPPIKNVKNTSFTRRESSQNTMTENHQHTCDDNSPSASEENPQNNMGRNPQKTNGEHHPITKREGFQITKGENPSLTKCTTQVNLKNSRGDLNFWNKANKTSGDYSLVDHNCYINRSKESIQSGKTDPSKPLQVMLYKDLDMQTGNSKPVFGALETINQQQKQCVHEIGSDIQNNCSFLEQCREIQSFSGICQEVSSVQLENGDNHYVPMTKKDSQVKSKQFETLTEEDEGMLVDSCCCEAIDMRKIDIFKTYTSSGDHTYAGVLFQHLHEHNYCRKQTLESDWIQSVFIATNQERQVCVSRNLALCAKGEKERIITIDKQK